MTGREEAVTRGSLWLQRGRISVTVPPLEHVMWAWDSYGAFQCRLNTMWGTLRRERWELFVVLLGFSGPRRLNGSSW